MRRLIVNADDLGAGNERDRGIFQSFTQGIVTSASLLANGPSFASAARGALELALPLGVHLNLSEGLPLGGAIPEFTTNGLFPGKARLREILSRTGFDPSPLYRELAMQIERVSAAGITPDHLDTHQHFCLYPGISTILLQLAEEYNIPALRTPLPAEPADADPGGELGAELNLYRRLVPGFVRQVKSCNILTPDGLLGMPLLNRLDQHSLLATLHNIPAGTWELMVHPGYTDPGGPPFSSAARQVELTALTSPECIAAIVERAITLITFRDLSCAS